MDVIIIMIGLVALALAAMRWGVNSTDGINSPEWECRQRWYGFHEKEDVWPRSLKRSMSLIFYRGALLVREGQS